MTTGDTARIDSNWAQDPVVIALCTEAECPVVGSRLAIGRDTDGYYVARWAGGVVRLHVDLDRDRDEYVSHEGVEATVHWVRPVRPAPRFEAYVLFIKVDPKFNPPSVRTPREPDPPYEGGEMLISNDF